MMWQGVARVWAQLIMWALVCYGTLILLRDLVRWLNGRHEEKKTIYFVLVTENADKDIEGVIRTLLRKSRDLEQLVRVCVIDANSSDDTLSIVNRFSREMTSIELMRVPSYGDALEAAMHIGEGTNCVRYIVQLRQHEKVTGMIR